MAYVLQRKTRLITQEEAMKYLKLIRYQNLIMIALMQLIFHYGFLKQQNTPVAMNDWQYGLLILSTLLIAAAGYVINDIMDQETDNDNKPQNVIIGKGVSEAMAYNIYFGLNVSGVIIGYYLANLVNKTSFFGIFIITSILLYLYATSFKQIAILGNATVALVLSLSVIIIGMFDVIPATYEGNQAVMKVMLSILLDYAIFAFIINFIREIVKDLEDIEGDDNQGMRTLPIVIGIKKTKMIVVGLGVIASALLLWYINSNLMMHQLYYAVVYSLLLVIAPMIFFLVKVWNATSKKEFHFLSTVLKGIIFFGILSIYIITLNIQHHA